MISTRFGAAVAVVLALAAVGVGVAALMSTLRDDGPVRGRVVQSRLTNDYDGPPMLFPLDEFYIGRGSDGRLRAFYVFPPSYYGHVRGCRVIWDGNAMADTPSGKAGPGLYVEPCGGAHFDRDGTLVSGDAERGLDRFATSPAVDGMLVDTRQLLCGEAPPSPSATADSGADSTASPTPELKTCDRVSPDEQRP